MVTSMSDSHGAQQIYSDWPKQIQNTFGRVSFVSDMWQSVPRVQILWDWFQTPMQTVAETPGIRHQYHHCMSATKCQQLTTCRPDLWHPFPHKIVTSGFEVIKTRVRDYGITLPSTFFLPVFNWVEGHQQVWLRPGELHAKCCVRVQDRLRRICIMVGEDISATSRCD